MAKDFVGLNICVRDIFQGSGDCGHPKEDRGYLELNTLGFSRNATGLSTMTITIEGLDLIEDQDYFVLTASGDLGPNIITFGFASGSVPEDVKINTTGISLPPANENERRTLGFLISDSISSNFNVHVKGAVPRFSNQAKTASFTYEHCYLSVATENSSSIWNAGSSNQAGGPFYNDVPSSFVATRGVLHSLNLHRNGPYGWPTWKQIRSGENRINQYLKRNNKLTVVEPDDRIVVKYSNGSTQTVPRRNATLVCFDEPAVTSKHYPLIFNVGKTIFSGRTGRTRRFAIKSSYNNNITFFSNNEVNSLLKTPELEDDNYGLISNMYLRGALDDESSPLDSFEFVKFRQTVFPREPYTYKSFVRKRPSYQNSYWRTNRENRKRQGVSSSYGGIEVIYNGFYDNPSNLTNPPKTICMQSSWPLDSNSKYQIGHYVHHPGNDGVAWWGVKSTGDPYTIGSGSQGILQNPYSQYATGFSNDSHPNTATPRGINYSLKPSPLYSLRHSSLFTWIDMKGQSNGKTNIYGHLNPSGLVALRDQPIKFSDDDGESGTISNELDSTDFLGGETNWDVPEQSNREPFYDSIDDFSDSIKRRYKEYSIIPEFRMSNHVEFYSQNGIKEENQNLFEITGGRESLNNSSKEDFYKVYSTTDFLKNFDIIQREHSNFVEPSSISLSCKAVKKFIPYDDFYPAQRCVSLARQFVNSYKDHISYSSASWTDGVGEESYKAGNSDYEADFAGQNILAPLFAPGVLFNSIKSGVACDWPGKASAQNTNAAAMESCLTTNGGNSGNDPLIGGAGSGSVGLFSFDKFDFRIPFEAIVEPEVHLANKSLALLETATSGATGVVSSWNGKRNNDLYVKMANNFTAEVPNFFLEDQSFSSIVSMPQGHPDFGYMVSGSLYMMRIKMYRTMNSSSFAVYTSGAIDPDRSKWFAPQDIARKNYGETITMYSRPSAFGPALSGLTQADQAKVTYDQLSSSAYENLAEHASALSVGFDGSKAEIAKSSLHGYNFPYTPPYYHGEAWADVFFKCGETKKYTLSQILSKCSVRITHDGLLSTPNGATGTNYRRFAPEPYFGLWSPNDKNWEYSDTSPGADRWGPQTMSGNLINENAMQLDSTLNLFSKGQLERVDLPDDNSTGTNVKVVVDTIEDDKSRWVIQTKFETPILNFNNYVGAGSSIGPLAENGVTFPRDNSIHPDRDKQYHSASARMVARGMWHQFGEIPSSNEGIYLQVEDVPLAYMNGIASTDGLDQEIQDMFKSLKDVVGFRSVPKKLGQLADAKVIREAVVAVPFIDKEGSRKFFSIPRKDINRAKSPITKQFAGKSVIDMVEKMQRYVFPPSMDFVTYDAIDPFAMYIFEFKHVLTKKDLSHIWQNVCPDITLTHEEAESSISHELLSHELLGEGAKFSTTEDGKLLDEGSKNTKFDSNVRWMVFKVKQKGEVDYFSKVIGKERTRIFKKGDEQSPSFAGSKSRINYNWPYDFFSLVELVKMDVEVEFSNIERDNKTRARRVSPVASKTNFNVDLANPSNALGKPKK